MLLLREVRQRFTAAFVDAAAHAARTSTAIERVSPAAAAEAARAACMGAGTSSVSVCNNSSFGDFQCSAAFRLCKTLPGLGNAPKVATEVVRRLQQQRDGDDDDDGVDMVESSSVGGSGIVSVTANRAWIAARLRALPWPPKPSERRRRVIIDMSSPNIAKRMHVGHLRSTVIGDCLARVLRARGHDVVCHNHIGDWGSQFGALIAQLNANPTRSPTRDDETMNIGGLERAYKASKKRLNESYAFRRQAQSMVKRLQDGDADVRRVWSQVCQVSRADFERLYERLGVSSLMERGESFYNDMLAPLVDELVAAGIAEYSDGAVVVFELDKDGQKLKSRNDFPLIIRKRDGAFTYDTTDLAALRHRLVHERADRVIYVTDAGQGPHFHKVFEIGRRAGWLDPTRHQVEFAGHGVVLGPDGKKFRTREGDAIYLAELLDEAQQRALGVLKSRDATETDSLLDVSVTAMGVGVSAVRYADLCKQRLSDYAFSFDEMLALRGNTSVYVQYAYVRIVSIFRRASQTPLATEASVRLSLETPRERKLALLLLRYEDVLESVVANLKPHVLCAYVYELAGAVNAFYEQENVLRSARRDELLHLLSLTERTLKDALDKLGISVLERM